MPQLINIQGLKFNRLTVISRAENDKGGKAIWKCLCECGKLVVASGTDIRSGHTKSCGCFKSDMTSQRNMIHGCSKKNPIYKTWCGMRTRCNNKNHVYYKHYGGRGIKVCDRWNDFNNFLEDMGEKPSPAHTLERVDNDGHYEHNNVRWATKKEQASNSRKNKFIIFYGTKKTLSEWARVININPDTLSARLCNGWTIQRALTTPLLQKDPEGYRCKVGYILI